MPLNATLLEREDWPRYEALNRTSPHGSVFSSASFPAYHDLDLRILGVFKGRELVGATLLPVAGESLVRVLASVPWWGPVARTDQEGECQEIARRVAEYCQREFGEATLTCPPQWTDIRAFNWAGWRAHVRYTYRGDGTQPYEKRVSLRPCFIARRTLEMVPETWQMVEYATGDSRVVALRDCKASYYWQANGGGQWHAELVDAIIKDAAADGLLFDLVGCNGPSGIWLFKRGFGGRLTAYYAVSTSDARDLRESTYRSSDMRALPDRAHAAGL